MPIHPSPDKDELYQRLLPIYQAAIQTQSYLGLYNLFSKYWDMGKSDYSAGEALQKTLMEFGLIPLEDISSMEDGALEYEDVMAGMEIIDAL